MTKKQIFISIIGLVLLLVFVAYLPERKPSSEPMTENYSVKINDKSIRVEVARSLSEKIQGLSGRQNLAEDTGMLFIYDKPESHSFWMKDMNFSIDIIWLDTNWKIIDITRNASPDSFPERFRPKLPAQFVLEVSSNFVENNKVELGQAVEPSSDLQKLLEN